MDRVAEGGIPLLVLRVLLGLALTLSPARAQEDSKPEVVPALDPYTRGERAAFDAAGYVSLGPFPWCEGTTSDELARELGAPWILWIETEHFRMGSTLATYDVPSDRIEKKRLETEFARVRSIFPDAKPRKDELDPWLRAHLYAQRLEAIHAAYMRDFGLRDEDFADAAKPDGLGMRMKYTVLLAERRSTLARCVRHLMERDTTDPTRDHLAGGSIFFGVSAESVRAWGQPTDAALHAMVAANVAMNLAAGYRGMRSTLPVWFEYGYSHVASRRVDERFTLLAQGTQREGADAWKWEPRVAGLVSNDYASSWTELAEAKHAKELSGPEHLVAWSRVGWMLETFGPERARRFLAAVTDPLPQRDELDRAAHVRDRQLDALVETGGAPLADLEAAWRRWASKATSKR